MISKINSKSQGRGKYTVLILSPNAAKVKRIILASFWIKFTTGPFIVGLIAVSFFLYDYMNCRARWIELRRFVVNYSLKIMLRPPPFESKISSRA
jgi:hypothetical protein